MAQAGAAVKIEIDTVGVPATEDEATRMWCPFTRVAFMGSHVGNRVSTAMLQMTEKSAERGEARDYDYFRQQQADCNCIASRCMAWRWAGYHRRGDNAEATGFCGLAGKPELTT
jgi:hypothetical protein